VQQPVLFGVLSARSSSRLLGYNFSGMKMHFNGVSVAMIREISQKVVTGDIAPGTPEGH
jgi:hypothetical protein